MIPLIRSGQACLPVSSNTGVIRINNVEEAQAPSVPIIIPLSKEHAKQIANDASDYKFLSNTLDLLASHDSAKVQAFLRIPVLSARLRQFFDVSSQNLIELLLEFIIKNPRKMQDSFVQTFIAQQLVRGVCSRTIQRLCNNKSRDLDIRSSLESKIVKLLMDPKCPKAIREPLEQLISKERTFPFLQLLRQHSKGGQDLAEGMIFPASRETKGKAIDVAYEIDGTDFRDNSIRILIHRCGEKEAVRLIRKIIEDFRSGKRRFVFKRCEENVQVPVENYKEVMLYVIQSLKEAAPFFKHNAMSFEEVEKSHDLNVKSEWAARRLIQMEEQVRKSTTSEEIQNSLECFRESYMKYIVSDPQISIATCLSPYIFNLKGSFKPFMQDHVPLGLIDLASALNLRLGDGDLHLEQAVEQLSTHLGNIKHTKPGVEEGFSALEYAYSELVEQPTNKELIKKVLAIWNAIPGKEMLFDDYSLAPKRELEELKDLIAILEDELGISRRTQEYIREKWERTTWARRLFPTPFEQANETLYKRYPFLDRSFENDPAAALQSLQRLKQEVDEIKVKYHQEITKEFNQFSAEIDRVLSAEAIPIKFKKGWLPAERLKSYAMTRIVENFEGTREKIQSLREVLKNPPTDQLTYLTRLFATLEEIRLFIHQAQNNPTLHWRSWDHIPPLMQFLEEFELAMIEALGSDSLRFVSRVALANGALSQEVDDIQHLQLELEKERKARFVGFQDLRACILNTPKILETLEQHGYTLDGIVLTLQGSLNNRFASALDRLLVYKQDSQVNRLTGYPTQAAQLVGKIKFISEGTTAQKGDILVMENIAPEVHRYANASAIISRQGGVFSHGAITFTELGIPALLGCAIEKLRDFEGQWVQLTIDQLSECTPVSPDHATVLEELPTLTLETAIKLETLLEGRLKKIACRQFYAQVYAKLSAKEIVDFWCLPAGREEFERQRTQITEWKKRLVNSENPLERAFYFRAIEKKLHKLIEVVVEIDPSLALQLQFERIQLHLQNTPTLNCITRSFGKRGNLDRLQTLLKTCQMPHITWDIPFYKPFHFEARKQIEVGMSFAEFSQEMIVRSSSSHEDTLDRSGAGIFESIVVKDKAQAPEAIRNVLASAFSERALAFYGSNQKKAFDMEIIIQNYVADGEYSGVAFSISKTWDIVGMQVVKGLGGGVDGKGSPVYVYVNTANGTLEDVQVAKGEKLPADLRNLKELAQLLKLFEKDFQGPVEIEFVGKGNHFSIVQLRPIVVSECS